jgi:hypothetical protein
LCITIKRGERVKLQHVSFKYQKGKFAVDATWRLEDIARFDAEDDDGDVGFVLEFGVGKEKPKAVHFRTHDAAQRNEFLWLLVQQCQEYVRVRVSNAQ